MRLTQESLVHSISNGLLYFLVLGVAGYAVVAYGFLPLGSLVHPDMKTTFLEHSYAIYTHAFASIVALTTGPFQFSARIRQQYTNLHRWLGRSYLAVGVLVGGLSGLYMSQFAYGGLMARLGFATLAVLWLYTGLRAYLAVRGGAIAEHRKWMMRNFSLTFAAVTLRLYLPVSMAAGVEFALAYPIIAWLCWVPNLALAECAMQYRANVIPVKYMDEISNDDAYSLARSIAKKIVSGELSEYEGGMKIWKEVIDKLGASCPDNLWPFKSNTSAIEDIKWNAEQGGNRNERLIHQCEQEILAAARKLVDQT